MNMSTPEEIPFQNILDALLDVNTPFPPRYLYRLSDLAQAELAELEKTWTEVPDWRRQALMEDIEELGGNDLILSFEGISRFAIQDPDPKVRSLAIRALWDYETDDLIPALIRFLESDGATEVRAAAATALGRFVYMGEIDELPTDTLRQVEDHLLQAVKGSDATDVRRRALESLGYSSREEVPPLIESAFYSGNNDWIMSALFAMGRSANEEWEPQILEMLESDSVELRTEAARAAGELEDRNTVPRLVELLNDEEPEARTSAIWALSQIGGEGVRDILEQMFEDTEDEEEADFIESALDNLAFTEDMELFSLLDVEDEEEEDEEVGEDGEDFNDDILDTFEEDEDLDEGQEG